MILTRIIMGMPIIVEIPGAEISIFERVFDYFKGVDERFSIYKKSSEISLINQGKIQPEDYSPEMGEVLDLCEKTKQATDGFFDIFNGRILDPSGLVKGWAIQNASKLIQGSGFKNFYISAGGDVTVSGKKASRLWRVGIRNPFKTTEIVKVLSISGGGVATSALYERGEHIYNPKGKLDPRVVSLTVIGPNIYEADRMATAAFAMGQKGLEFIERLKGFDGYLIDSQGLATKTSGFQKYETD